LSQYEIMLSEVRHSNHYVYDLRNNVRIIHILVTRSLYDNAHMQHINLMS